MLISSYRIVRQFPGCISQFDSYLAVHAIPFKVAKIEFASRKKVKLKDVLVRNKSKNHANPALDDHLQNIPQRLREIMKSKEMMKMGSRHRKKAPKPNTGQKGDIPVPHFRKGKGESVKAYIHRMTQESEHVLFLTNNQVDRKPEKGKTERQLKKPENQTEEEKSTKRKCRAKLQQAKKKLAQREKLEEEAMFTDEVQFGEVNMAPPSLTVKPKKATIKPQGAYKGLLLNSLLGHSPVSVAEPSMARKRIMEEERERVVHLYRQMKKKQMDKKEKDRR
ncbi:Coiled-coil domain-containing protein 137 [Triplophysa tibetana]|uniref:Coiled-coil domain-containing protein 137 n=1 Tax=Triplophysa tibetana TaxID=1572043 RepID=A0A5A9N7X6_9TELE|nr:Coiled-coil domain-containing protein 137 [Triplophysa tibetana]